MSKRSANDTQDGQPFQKAQASGNRREVLVMDERGEFEDAWEDEIESDQEVVNADGGEEDEDGLQSYKASRILIMIDSLHHRRNGCRRCTSRYRGV